MKRLALPTATILLALITVPLIRNPQRAAAPAVQPLSKPIPAPSAIASGSQVSAPSTSVAPPALPSQEDIRRLIQRTEADGYQIHSDGPAITAANGRHQISAQWSAADGGMRIESLDSKNLWHFRLKSPGPVKGVETKDQTLTFQREGMEEWFINDTQGIEHGFNLPQPPARSGDDGFQVNLELETSLMPEIQEAGRTAVFRDHQGDTALRYSGLLVLDAVGRSLPARMELTGTESESWQLALHVDDRGARYPLVIDPVFTTTTNQTFQDISGNPGDNFGFEVSMSGNWLAVGIPYYDSLAPGGVDFGAVFLYEYDEIFRNWKKRKTIVPENPAGAGSFGFSLELDGGTLIVGAPSENGSFGAAYIFERDNGGFNQWGQVQKLVPADGQPAISFGYAVAVDGGIAAIGAPFQTGGGMEMNAGAIYTSLRNNMGAWHAPVRLTASPETNDNLGWALAVSGNRIAVSALYGQLGIPIDTGLVSIYDLTLQDGSLISYDTGMVTEPNPGTLAAFGSALDLEGDTLVVGSREKTTSAGASAGAVEIFTYDTVTGWTWQTELRAPDGSAFDRFGESVSLSGDTLAVGASRFDTSVATPDTGAIYLFEKRTETIGPWAFVEQLLPPSTQAEQRYGSSVSISGDGIAIGSPFYNGVGGDDSGHVRIALRRSAAWLAMAAPQFTHPNAIRLGQAIALDRDRAAIGNPHWGEGFGELGNVALYRANHLGEEAWNLETVIFNPTGQAGDLFGHSVALAGNLLLVGAPGHDLPGAPDAGAAFIFRRTDAGGWAFLKALEIPGLPSGAEFGYAVALTSRWAFVGAPGSNTGYVFDRFEGGTDNWDVSTIINESADGGRFGSTIVVDGDFAAFAAPDLAGFDSLGGMLPGAGRVKIYRTTRLVGKDVWQSVITLPAVNPDGSFGTQGEHFGASLALDQGLLAAGAPGYLSDAGRVRIFGINEGGSETWGLMKTLSRATPGERFGSSLAVGSRWIFIGADAAQRGGIPTGVVYTYDRKDLAVTPTLPVSELHHPISREGDEFGAAMAFSDNELVVGCPGRIGLDGVQGNGGFVVYHRQSTAWQALGGALGSAAQTGDQLGTSVAMNEEFLIAGAPFDNVSGSAAAGSAQLYRREPNAPSGWAFVKTITAGDVQVGANFGASADISGDTLAIGAPGWDGKGAVYVFKRNIGGADQWGQLKRIDFITSAAGDDFGAAVALDEEILAIGAPGRNAPGQTDAGAVYVLGRHSGGVSNWGFITLLLEPSPTAFDFFGSTVDVNLGRIMVGAPLADDRGNASGNSYIFARSGGSAAWAFLASPPANEGATNDRLGSSVALDGQYAIAGAPGESDFALNSGAAWIFRDLGGDGVSWLAEATIRVGDSELPAIHPSMEFGKSVAMKGDQVAVGASGYDEGAVTNIGAAYVFERNQSKQSAWGQVKKLVAPAAGFAAQMGAAVAMTTDFVVAGAPTADQGAQVDAGYIFIFGDVGSAYEDWARAIFGDGVVNDAAQKASVWGHDADPDHDGLANAVEAFMATDPQQSSQGENVIKVIRNDADGLIFRYRQGKETHGAEGKVTWSRDLDSWRVAEDGDIDDFEIVTRVHEDHDTHYMMEARISANQLIGESKLFLRLEVNVP